MHRRDQHKEVETGAKSRKVRLHAAAVSAGASDLIEHLDADRVHTREEAMCSRRDLLLFLPMSTGYLFPAF